MLSWTSGQRNKGLLQNLALAKGDSNLRSDTVLEPDDPRPSPPYPWVAGNSWHLLRAHCVANTYISQPPPSFILSPLLDLVPVALPYLSVSRACTATQDTDFLHSLALSQGLCMYHFLGQKTFTHTQLWVGGCSPAPFQRCLPSPHRPHAFFLPNPI